MSQNYNKKSDSHDTDQIIKFYKKERENIKEDAMSHRGKMMKGIVPLRKKSKSKFKFFTATRKLSNYEVTTEEDHEILDHISSELKDKFWEDLGIDKRYFKKKGIIEIEFFNYCQKLIQKHELYPQICKLNPKEKFKALYDFLLPFFDKIQRVKNVFLNDGGLKFEVFDSIGVLVNFSFRKFQEFFIKKYKEIIKIVDPVYSEIFSYLFDIQHGIQNLDNQVNKKKSENIYLSFTGTKSTEIFNEKGLPKIPTWEAHYEKLEM